MGLHNQITGNYISENVSQSLHDLKYMGFVDCLDSVPGIFPSDHLTFLFLGSIMSDDGKRVSRVQRLRRKERERTGKREKGKVRAGRKEEKGGREAFQQSPNQ